MIKLKKKTNLRIYDHIYVCISRQLLKIVILSLCNDLFSILYPFHTLSIFLTQFGRKTFVKITDVLKTLQALRATAQSDCWFFPFHFFPLFSSSPRDSIAAHPARAVVFHCCERMQIAIPVPGPSINSNRINSSAVIVFCASQKTLYTRAASFCPATDNIRFIRTVAHVADFSSPIAPVFLWWWKSRSKIEPWVSSI